MRFTGGAAAIVALVALSASGCAFNSSPADGLQFRAPAGWRSSAGILGFVQFWRSPANDREVLMLFKSPTPLRSRDVFSNLRTQDAVTHLVVERRENIRICRNQAATYVEARGSSESGAESRTEIVTTNVKGDTYFAMYARPLNASPNPMAEAALRELCVKP